MEVCRPLKSDDKLKHRPLTPFRFLRGLISLVVFLATAFMLLAYLGPGAVLLRFFSIHLYRKATSFFFGLWLSLWPFLFEKINRTKVVFSGDNVPQKERVLLIVNHRTEVDWMYLWDLAMRKGCLGYIKYILKSSLMKIPVLGWGFHILEFISVERKWETDENVMHQMLSTFKDPRDPLWLALFPEGTDFTYFSEFLLSSIFTLILLELNQISKDGILPKYLDKRTCDSFCVAVAELSNKYSCCRFHLCKYMSVKCCLHLISVYKLIFSLKKRLLLSNVP
ncbi:hypothetical protein REPUB_Repub19eG0034300 [Reevesia pubescens]